MVPERFLGKIGNYSFVVGGTKIEVKLADTEEAIDKAIRYCLSRIRSPKVVGLDYKTMVPSLVDKSSPSYRLLVLCTAADDESEFGYSLVIHLDYLGNRVPDSFERLLSNPDICFVTPTNNLPSDIYNWLRRRSYDGFKSIHVGDLAARVLNEPDLYESRLCMIARTVGVPNLEFNGSSQILAVQKNMRVLTPRQVKEAVLDAYACASIGTKLLDDPA